MVARADIVDSAHALLRTPFHHQGRLPGVGLDCIGACGMAALMAGVPNALTWRDDPDCNNYARQPEPKSLLRACAKYFDEIPKQRLLPGDVVLMRFGGEPMHFALLVALTPPYIIHALYSFGQVVKHRLDPQWRSCVVRAYRFRGVD